MLKNLVDHLRLKDISAPLDLAILVTSYWYRDEPNPVRTSRRALPAWEVFLVSSDRSAALMQGLELEQTFIDSTSKIMRANQPFIENDQSLSAEQKQNIIHRYERGLAFHQEQKNLLEDRLQNLPRLQLNSYLMVLQNELAQVPGISRSPAVATLFLDPILQGAKTGSRLRDAADADVKFLNAYFESYDPCVKLLSDPDFAKKSSRINEICGMPLDKIEEARKEALSKQAELTKSNIEFNYATAQALIKSNIVDPVTGEVKPENVKGALSLAREVVGSVDPTRLVPALIRPEPQAANGVPLRPNLPSELEKNDLRLTLLLLKTCCKNLDNCSAEDLEAGIQRADMIFRSWSNRGLSVPFSDRVGYDLILWQARAAAGEKREALISSKTQKVRDAFEQYRATMEQLQSNFRECVKAGKQCDDVLVDIDLANVREAAALRELESLVQQSKAQGYPFKFETIESIQEIADKVLDAAVTTPDRKWNEEVAPVIWERVQATGKKIRDDSIAYDLKFLKDLESLYYPSPIEAAKALAHLKKVNQDNTKFGIPPDTRAEAEAEGLVQSIRNKDAELAAAVTAYIAPYLPSLLEAGKFVGEKAAGETIKMGARELWSIIKAHFTEQTGLQDAARLVASEPSETTYQKLSLRLSPNSSKTTQSFHQSWSWPWAEEIAFRRFWRTTTAGSKTSFRISRVWARSRSRLPMIALSRKCARPANEGNWTV
jgi:hypothetical protein